MAPKLLLVFSIPGKVPLFFYGMHIAIMGVFVKTIGFVLPGGRRDRNTDRFCGNDDVMIPLCMWFYRVKSKSGIGCDEDDLRRKVGQGGKVVRLVRTGRRLEIVNKP